MHNFSIFIIVLLIILLSHGIFVNRRMGDKLQSHLKDQVLVSDWILPTWFVECAFQIVCVCVCVCVCVHVLSHVWLFDTPWTVACQGPLSMEFSRQKYWCGLPLSTLDYLPSPGIEPTSLAPPALAGRFFSTALPGKPYFSNFHPLKSYDHVMDCHTAPWCSIASHCSLPTSQRPLKVFMWQCELNSQKIIVLFS